MTKEKELDLRAELPSLPWILIMFIFIFLIFVFSPMIWQRIGENNIWENKEMDSFLTIHYGDELSDLGVDKIITVGNIFVTKYYIEYSVGDDTFHMEKDDMYVFPYRKPNTGYSLSHHNAFIRIPPNIEINIKENNVFFKRLHENNDNDEIDYFEEQRMDAIGVVENVIKHQNDIKEKKEIFDTIQEIPEKYFDPTYSYIEGEA